MNILFVAPYSEYNAKIEAALRRTEHHITSVPERTAPFWRYVRRIGVLRQWTNQRLNKRILSVAEREKFDAILVIKGTTVRAETLAVLRRRGMTSANWFPENVKHAAYSRWLEKNRTAYDFFMSFDSSIPGAVYVPFAVDPQSWVDGVPDTDVVFVGAPYPERVRTLEAVKKMGVSLKIFGWKGWKTTSLADVYHGPLTSQESARAYRSAKISLNMNLEPAVAGVNLKTFEIPAAGGFQLSDYRSDVDGLFAPGKEIAIFNNDDELNHQLRYYLEHDRERRAIARAGYDRVVRDHTLDKRVGKIIKLFQS